MLDIILGTENFDFYGEIILRTLVMFFLVLLVLRLLGRKGVRQLTLFEMAIIISLGSAAGDPMFQGDIPVIYAILVFVTVALTYKSITWLVTRNRRLEKLMEGIHLTVVLEGRFSHNIWSANSFSQMEFFSELRNQNIEHLGQVKEAILEVDGTMSVLFYGKEEVRFGLPIFPSAYREISGNDVCGPVACMHCGNVLEVRSIESRCSRCSQGRWAKAIRTQRVG